MKFKVDLDLDLWVQDIEVEIEDEETILAELRNKVIEKISEMSVEDILSNATIKDSNFDSVDVLVTEEDLEVEVFDIEYDETEEENLPEKVSLNVHISNEDGYDPVSLLDEERYYIEEELKNEIADMIDSPYFEIRSCDYRIVKRY